ncbi:MAG: integral rane protein MviN [Francisellaceae bacterium]|nr:integral rane protein MviN [Francisellaceae bacterium]
MSKALLKSTSIFGAMTLISRLLGYVRDMVIARYFGATSDLDAFIMAFKIPNFMRRLFAEGAFSQAFVPILSEYKTTQPEQEIKLFINRVAGNLFIILFGVTLLGIICSPFFIYIFAPGFKEMGTRFELASFMLRITWPYLLLISLTAFCGGILNTYGKFAGPSFTPVFLNLSMIACSVWLAPTLEEPVVALAIGVTIGGVIQLLFQIPFLKKIDKLPYPVIYWQDPGVRRILYLMLPALLGVSVNQLNLLIDSSFASYLKVGSVSWLYYSDRLMEFPLGIFGVGIATVILPALARAHTKQNHQDFSRLINWGLKLIFLIGVPSSIGLAMLAKPLLICLFYSGKFNQNDVTMSSQSLMAYSLGILGFMLVKVLASSFYAKQDIKTPVKIAIKIVVIHIFLNFILMKLLAHSGLALATSLAASLNALFLFINLKKKGIFVPIKGWGKLFLQIIGASITLIYTLYYFTPPLETWLNTSLNYKLFTLGKLMSLGMIAYIATLLVLGLRLKNILLDSTGENID